MGTFRTRTGSECCGETRGLGSKGNEWEDLIIACGDSGFLVSFISICVHERRAEEGAAPRGIYAGDNRPVGAARDTSRGSRGTAGSDARTARAWLALALELKAIMRTRVTAKCVRCRRRM